MKIHAFLLPALMLVGPLAIFAGAASAQDQPVATKCASTSEGCLNTKYKHRITFPAGALSHTATHFTAHPRGIDWPQPVGTLSLTMRRPLDVAADAKVRVTVVYEVRAVATATSPST